VRGAVVATVKKLLADAGTLNDVVLPLELDALLSALDVDGVPVSHPGDISTGEVELVSDPSKSPLPGFDFALTLPQPGIKIPFKLKLATAAKKFWF
jgi:hypothetical protein